MLNYFYMTATGKFQGLDSDGVAGQFTNMLGQPVTMGILDDRCCYCRCFCLLPRSSERP